MNKPLIRSLMIACAASMALPAQGVMVARKKKQDPKPDAPKAEAKAEVDVKALHEKLMKALAEADLSDAERTKVMETIGKALHKAHGDAGEVHHVRAVDVVGEPLEGEARVFVVGGDGEGGKKNVRVMGSDAATIHSRIKVGDEVLDLREIKERAKAGAKAPTAESRAVWVEKAAEGESGAVDEQILRRPFRIAVHDKPAGEQAVEVICEEVCEEGEAPKTRVIRRIVHGEPMEIEMGEIEIAEPMILELENVELKIDQQHRAVEVQRKKADELRARAEKLRAAVAGVDPTEAHDVRVYVGDLAKTVDVTKNVQFEVERLHEAIAKAHAEGHQVHSIGGDGAMVFEWTGDAPKVVTKDKVKAKSKNKAKAKAEKADGDMAEAIRELREEMRELRQMMKQIRKEMRDEDEMSMAPTAPESIPAPAAAPAAPAFGAMPARAPLPASTAMSASAPLPVRAPLPVMPAMAPMPAAAPMRVHTVGGLPTTAAEPTSRTR